MNAQQMHIGVNLGVQKVDSNAYDNLLPEEIDYYLNKAIREYVRRQNIYLREDLKGASRHDYIADNEASYNLGSLLSTHTYVSTDLSLVTEFSNVKSAPLSLLSDTMFSLIYAQMKSATAGDWNACKLISTSEIHKYSETGSNLPVFRRNPIAIVGEKFYIFWDQEDGDVNELNVLYIKEPAELALNATGTQVTTSDLPVHTHDDIVNLAVGFITEDIKSARPYEQNQTTVKGEDA